MMKRTNTLHPFLETVLNALRGLEMDPEIGPGGRSVRWVFLTRKGAYPFTFALGETDEIVTLTLEVLQGVPEDRRFAVCEFLVRVNTGKFPGALVMDAATGDIRYRLVLDLAGSTLSEEMVRRYLAYAVAKTDRSFEGLHAVVHAGHHPAEASSASASSSTPRSPPPPPATPSPRRICSALPVAYGDHPRALWEPFARLILEAAYEATLAAAVLNARRTGNPTVFLTLLGGGAFGNDRSWILDALRRALRLYRTAPLQAVVVAYRHRDPAVDAMIRELEADAGKTR